MQAWKCSAVEWAHIFHAYVLHSAVCMPRHVSEREASRLLPNVPNATPDSHHRVRRSVITITSELPHCRTSQLFFYGDLDERRVGFGQSLRLTQGDLSVTRNSQSTVNREGCLVTKTSPSLSDSLTVKSSSLSTTRLSGPVNSQHRGKVQPSEHAAVDLPPAPE